MGSIILWAPSTAKANTGDALLVHTRCEIKLIRRFLDTGQLHSTIDNMHLALISDGRMLKKENTSQTKFSYNTYFVGSPLASYHHRGRLVCDLHSNLIPPALYAL